MADRTRWHQGATRQTSDDVSTEDDLLVVGGLFLEGRQFETVSTNKTLDAGDSGVVQKVDTDAVVVTLPATVVGLVYTIMNVAADGAALVSVSPNAADKITGNGYTATDDKDAQNTKATAKRGDYITLLGDGSLGWYCVDVRGIWARE